MTKTEKYKASTIIVPGINTAVKTVLNSFSITEKYNQMGAGNGNLFQIRPGL